MPNVVNSDLITLAAAIQSLNPVGTLIVIVHGRPPGRCHWPPCLVKCSAASRLAALAVSVRYRFSAATWPGVRYLPSTEEITPVVVFDATPLIASPTFCTASRLMT